VRGFPPETPIPVIPGPGAARRPPRAAAGTAGFRLNSAPVTAARPPTGSHRAASRPRAPRRRARDVRDDLTSTVKGILTALLWVLLGLGSLACTVVATWVCLSMAKAAAVGKHGFAASSVWLWVIAIVVTLGL